MRLILGKDMALVFMAVIHYQWYVYIFSPLWFFIPIYLASSLLYLIDSVHTYRHIHTYVPHSIYVRYVYITCNTCIHTQTHAVCMVDRHWNPMNLSPFV